MDASEKKALLASHPDLQARFLRESALRKPSFLADIDFLDCTIRSEIMTSVQGAPAMTAGGDDTYRRSRTSSASLVMRASSTATSHASRMQLPLIPCYALTVDVDVQRTSVSHARTLYLAAHTHTDGAHVQNNFADSRTIHKTQALTGVGKLNDRHAI